MGLAREAAETLGAARTRWDWDTPARPDPLGIPDVL